MQKQGGEYFLKSIASDRTRPSAGDGKDRLSWVIACSAEAFDALKQMKEESDSAAMWLLDRESQAISAPIDFETRQKQSYIFGQLKNEISRFDRIDNALKVGEILCPSVSRTYPYIKDEARAVLSIIEKRYSDHDSQSLMCLDIGSGAGIYAFYLCDCFPNAQVTAIEPDDGACQHWLLNRKAANIPPERCSLVPKTFEEFAETNLANRWDLVVFNLPYVPNGQPGTYFVHSDGGGDGLEKVRPVLDWLNRDDVRVARCIFPVYSLARAETIDSTLLATEIQGRSNLFDRYNIEYANPLTPNWFVLRYTDDSKQKFLALEQAFPEARRRSDVANWLYELKHGPQKWSHVCHTIVELTQKP